MSSNWIRSAAKYALLLTPVTVLCALVALVALGAWVTAILREPARFADAPALVRTLTRAAYWHTRTHWQMVRQCVEFEDDVLYRPKPGSCEFANAEFRTTMHFDGSGARRTPLPPPTESGQTGKPRILIVGDSHAMGWGVEDDETFASVLAATYGYRTLNLAVSSYGTPRELLRLERHGQPRPDDLVIIQYCDNDLAEGRHFAEFGRAGPYQPAELDALLAYRPTPASALPVAGLLLRLTWGAFLHRIALERPPTGPAPLSATDAFLRVIEAHPALRRDRLMVVAINGPGAGTHLSAERLAASGIALLVPRLEVDDFYDIDDHMRARGHAKVAAQIAAAIDARHAQDAMTPPADVSQNLQQNLP